MTNTKQNMLLEFLKNSTPEQRKQARAIVKFISKLMSVSPSSTLEDQMTVLLDYFHIDSDHKYTKEQMPEYMQKYVDSICEEFYISNKQDFANLDEQDPLCIILGLTIAERVFSSDQVDKSEEYEVYDIYCKRVDSYRLYVENYIIDNNRFDITKNSEEVFRYFLHIKEEHTQENKNINLGQVYSRFSVYMRKYIAVILNLQQQGLDEQSLEEMVQTMLINESSLVAMSLKNHPGRNLGPIQGLTDEPTLRGHIATIDEISNNFSLSKKHAEILENNKKILSNMIPPQSGGCLGVLIAILGIATGIGGLFTWTISSLFA